MRSNPRASLTASACASLTASGRENLTASAPLILTAPGHASPTAAPSRMTLATPGGALNRRVVPE